MLEEVDHMPNQYKNQTIPPSFLIHFLDYVNAYNQDILDHAFLQNLAKTSSQCSNPYPPTSRNSSPSHAFPFQMIKAEDFAKISRRREDLTLFLSVKTHIQ